MSISSEGFGTVVLEPGSDPTTAPEWARHLAGVVALLGDHDVPAGASKGEDEARTVAVDGALAVPNHYWVFLSSADHSRFAEVETLDAGATRRHQDRFGFLVLDGRQGGR